MKPIRRFSAGTSVMSSPPMMRRPPSSGVSNPAMMRRSVVFPQPEGPRSTVRQPPSKVSVKGWSTNVSP